jgi:tRNA1Val (adenine37-N6)-methyltransferase
MVAIDTEAILERRDYFPRGLVQPEDGYRFSQDSMLLACFTNAGRGHTGVDLGCGSGPVGLGLLLCQPDLALTGVEIDSTAVACANENVVNLHFADRFSIVEGNVTDWRPEKVVDFVVANPPYRDMQRGRVSHGQERRTARFENKGDFVQFARCAANALKSRGKFSFIHLAERLPELMEGLSLTNLEPKRMRMVHGRIDEGARMVLMEAVKEGGVGLHVEPPLIMNEGKGKGTHLTPEAKIFCPFLT